MPRLLSNRKPVARPEDLKQDRWDYLNLQNAQPALGLAPEADTGFTLQTNSDGKVTYTNTLGKLQFENQVISATQNGVEVELSGQATQSNIKLTPYQTVLITGDVSIEQDLTVLGDAGVDGDFTVRGVPVGTFPINPNTLYVTPNGDDRNDGTALDSSRACRTISGAVRSPYYTPGSTIKVAAGTYFEDNPIPLKPYTSVIGNDLRTTFVEPLNKDLDLFHVNSGVYIAQMQMRNLRRGAVERYAPGGAGTYTTGAYCVAFPPSLDNPIDLYYSPYVQNCTNQSGPWLKDGTMFVPNQTIQIPLAAGTSTWAADSSEITVSIYTGTISVGMAVNDAANEGYRNAQLLLLRNKEFLTAQAVAFVDQEYPDLEYDKVKCARDVGYIVDAVSGDVRFGGNKRSIEAGLAYWSGATSLITGEQLQTSQAISYLRDLSLDIIVNNTVTNVYDTSTSQVIDLNLDHGSVVSTRVTERYDLISALVQQGENAVPAEVEDLLGLIYPTGLSPNDVNVASTITAITTVSDNVYTITLSKPTVSPSDNATIYFGYTSTYPYLDADIPENWKVNDGDKYADRRLDPTGSGGGALVDGNAPSLRSPIQSFVFDAFTQLTQGGIGVHIINNGYAQLVSVFTIMASQAVIVENGGIASITNSNSNFGDTCLTAKGLGKLAFQGFVRNPAYPTNVPNGEYYPLGYWPQKQQTEVFIPNDRDRPHIGQVMEVVPPDTYINYEGNRVPYVNEAGYPGYLVATVNTNTLVTGSYTIDDVDVTGVAVGHTLYVSDVFGSSHSPENGQPYISTGTQVVDINYRQIVLDRPILNGYVNENYDAFFNLYFCGNAYYTVLSSRVDESLASTVTNEVSLVPGQETTTSLAVNFARDLAIRIIQNQPVSGFVYDQAKCIRDTGLIVDSIALDLLYPTIELSQSNFAGLQYWNQENYTGQIGNEITTTTNAVRYIKQLAKEIVQNITTGTRYQSTVTQNIAPPPATAIEGNIVADDFEVIVDILVDGIAGVTDKIITNGPISLDSNLNKAYNLLTLNKEYIQAEAIAFIESTKFNYDRTKCARDTGLIVDSLAIDLAYPSDYTSQTTFAGLQYWSQNGYTGSIAEELTTTTNAITFVKNLAAEVVQNITTGTRYQSTVTQVVGLIPGTSAEADILSTDFDVILNILASGTDGVTDLIVPNDVAESTITNVVRAYNVLIANKSYIQAEAVAFVESTKTLGFEYDQALCYRDVGYMIDSVAFDLLHGGNKQAIQSGVYYYSFDGADTAIPDEIEQTIDAFNFIKSLSRRVILNQTGTEYQNVIQQVTNLTTATIAEAASIDENIDIIIDIVRNGPAAASSKSPVGLVASTDQNAINAALILEANKEYIKAEVIAYINETHIFEYDRSKCYRDVGYMVDSVAFDLLRPNGSVPSNKQAIQSGVSYYNYNASSTAIAGEIPQTTAAYNYIRQLIPYVVQGISTSTYQDFVPQVISASTGTTVEVDKLQGYIDHIVTIINDGPSAANAKVPISLDQSSDVFANEAYTALQENKRFIQEEVIAYINATNESGPYQTEIDQVFDYALSGGEDAVESLTSKFNIISNMIKDGASSSPEISRPRQYVDPNQNISNAKKLLDKNRRFIQEEVVAFVDNIWPSKFSYDPDKCSRDTGLIVDSLAQDLLFGGTSQSTFAGIQYWNQGTTVIPGEQTTTTNAVKYLKDVAQKVITNNTSSYRYQSTVTQVVSTITSSTSAVSSILGTKFDLITDILTNGVEGITDIIEPNSLDASTSSAVLAAYDLLQSNKEYLQHEIVAWVEANANFDYDRVKCARDTGLIVDSIAFDLLYPTSNDSQSTFAGLQYWNQDQYVGSIANEITTTTNAINYLSSIAQKVVVNDQSGTRYQTTATQTTSTNVATGVEAAAVGTRFGIILDILSTGTSGVTDLIVPNGRRSISTNTNFAYELLIANKEYLVEETVAYVESTKTAEFEYDQTKCRRDVGYMVDSVAFDLLHGGNKQSIQSGVLYYGYQPLESSISGEIPQTTAAYNRIKEILSSILSGVKITPSAGNEVEQITYMLPADESMITTAQSKIDKITNIINNGPAVAGELTPISLIPNTDSNADKAFDLLVANREFIKAEIVAYINSTFTGFVYDKEKCFRDVGYIVDSVSFDMLYGGNKQSIQSGVYYFGYNETSSAIAGEIPQTTSAYNFIEQIVSDIVTGTLISAPQQTLVTQVISTATGTLTEAQLIKNNVNLINNIIEYGPDEVLVKEPIGLTRSTDESVINAAKLLNANRNFIRAETIAFINNTYNTGFLYNKTKCARDTGLIVDSIAFDMLYEGTTESTFAGLQYWNQDTYTGTIQTEITTTTNAIRYLKEVVEKVMLRETVSVTTGNVILQELGLPSATQDATESVTANIDVILSILANGTSGVTDLIVPNGLALSDAGIVNSYNILQANKEFIQNEVIARIDFDNTEFEYDRTTCERDVGYIVDSLSFDLLHGGNRQSITSGVYYYGFNAADTVIDDQVPQTTAAYNYIKELLGSIITGQVISKTYQFKVKQVLSDSVGTSAETTLAYEKIENIITIINDGPDVAPSKQPISLAASTSTDVINAVNLLLANRNFIKAEVTSFIDSTFTNTPNYDKNKCYRDVGAIVDAVGYDLIYGGNYNSVNTGNGYFNRKGQYHIVRLEQNVTDPTLFIDGATVRFYQQSYISASGYLFEYVGAGTQYGALPQVGTADPQQSKEVVQLNNGKVFFTSTDQNGDFRIGPTLVISQSTGVLSGRTFQKSLYAEMTPFILVVGA